MAIPNKERLFSVPSDMEHGSLHVCVFTNRKAVILSSQHTVYSGS